VQGRQRDLFSKRHQRSRADRLSNADDLFDGDDDTDDDSGNDLYKQSADKTIDEHKSAFVELAIPVMEPPNDIMSRVNPTKIEKQAGSAGVAVRLTARPALLDWLTVDPERLALVIDKSNELAGAPPGTRDVNVHVCGNADAGEWTAGSYVQDKARFLTHFMLYFLCLGPFNLHFTSLIPVGLSMSRTHKDDHWCMSRLFGVIFEEVVALGQQPIEVVHPKTKQVHFITLIFYKMIVDMMALYAINGSGTFHQCPGRSSAKTTADKRFISALHPETNLVVFIALGNLFREPLMQLKLNGGKEIGHTGMVAHPCSLDPQSQTAWCALHLGGRLFGCFVTYCLTAVARQAGMGKQRLIALQNSIRDKIGFHLQLRHKRTTGRLTVSNQGAVTCRSRYDFFSTAASKGGSWLIRAGLYEWPFWRERVGPSCSP
jgi:hypothetical protein